MQENHITKIEYSDGTKRWFNENAELHREDGPAVAHSDGTKYWHINGDLHRENGPAIEYPDGTKIWYYKNKLHREDGPAVEYPNGIKMWYIDDKKLTEKEFQKYQKEQQLKKSLSTKKIKIF